MHQILQRFKLVFSGILIIIFAIIVVILVANSALAQFSSQSSSEVVRAGANNVTPAKAIRASIHRAKESWIQGDAAVFAALFTAQGEFIVPGNRWIGPNAIRQAATDFAASSSNVAIEIRRVLIAGNQALVEWHWEDTEKSTGKRNRADDAIVIDFIGGSISRWREYIDTQTPANSK